MTHSVENKTNTAHEPRKPKQEEENEEREHNLDQTIADSFPESDPPSSIPDHDKDQAA